MNHDLVLGIVLAAFVVVRYLHYRTVRRAPQRCPSCFRSGRGRHYGRYRCLSCGAHFVLDATGQPRRSITHAVHTPLSVSWHLLVCLALSFLTATSDLPFGPVLALLLVAPAGWELYNAFLEKPFKPT